MKPSATVKFLFLTVIASLAISGCGFSETPVPLLTATFVPPEVPTSIPVQLTSQTQPTSQPQVTPDTLTSAQKRALAHATVRIVLLKKKSGKLQPMGTGSGTILSPDGLILTNSHVASPAAMGIPEDEPDALGIEIVDTEDQPPVPTYFASVLAVDGTLDLAVIKIDQMLDGTSVKSQSLNLPYVKLGDSDAVQFGDPIFIFGFPGIGGDTITFTSGSVSGFDSMEPIGSRAWIKTDATIAGGNSGGLATNARGEIIGIPTRMGTSSASRVTDCRFIADTNGDGVIDEKDTCVPTGGFINAIRPVNWAREMINATKNGVAYESPYKQPTTLPISQPGETVVGNFSLDTWASEVDDHNCPTKPVETFPSGIDKIFAVFKFKDMTQGETWGYRWLHDDNEVMSKEVDWDFGSSGSCLAFSLYNNGKTLPDGTYKLEIFIGADLNLAGSAETEIGGKGTIPAPTGSGVTVSGKVVDANSGKGIAKIYVIVLNAGIDPDKWVKDGSEANILTFTQTDSKGNFTLPDELARGESYGMVVGNKDSGYRTVTGYVDIASDESDTVSLKIELNK